jgi:hypothetical protein
MLNLDVLCEAHRADLSREAAHDRLAAEVAQPASWRGTLSRALRAAADWIEPSHVLPRMSNAES